MADFLKTQRDEIAARLSELAPVVAEYQQLEAASAALAAIAPAATARAPRRAARAATKTPRASAPGRVAARGRPRGSGTRALQTLELVKASPGVTISELAGALGIKQNYLYRVLPALQKDGKVVKQGSGWHATEEASPPQSTTVSKPPSRRRRAQTSP